MEHGDDDTLVIWKRPNRNGGTTLKKSKRRHSTKTRAIRSVLFNWAGRVCSFGISFVLTPIVLLSLGNEAYGIWAITMAAAGYYTLADCGFQAATIKYIAQFEASGDRDSLNKTVATTVTSCSVMAAAVAASGLAVCWVFPFLFELKSEGVATVRWTVLLSALTVAVQLQGQVFRATLRALKRFDLENVIAVTSQLLTATLMIVVVMAGYGLVAMALVNLVAAVLVRATEAFATTCLLKGVRITPGGFDRATFRLLFGFSSMNVIRRVCNEGRRNSGSLIVGYFLGPAAVPFFAVAHTLVKKTHSLTQSVSSVVLPVASELDAQQKREQLLRMMVLVPRLLVTFAMAATVVFVMLGRPFVEFWIGADYVELTYPLLCILGVGFVANSFSGAQRQMLAGTGQIRAITILSVVSAILQIGLSLALVPTIGLVGIAWADLASSVVINTFACNYLACRVYGYPWGRHLAETLIRPLLTTVVGVLAALSLAAVFPPERTLHVALHAAVILAASGTAAFFVCLDGQARADILYAAGLHRFVPFRPKETLAIAERNL
ncbi:MAG: flippase [Planctomycetaceae bacterium]